MVERILITGGAGFVGSHLVDRLLEKGYAVRVYDNLDPQVHGESDFPPPYLNSAAEFIKGDVRDRDGLLKALQGVTAVFHLAAAVGVGQSMYEIKRYMEVNTLGTATMLECIVNKRLPIEKMIVAASMSAYGEGAYACNDCGEVFPETRTEVQLREREWEFRCPQCSNPVTSIATSENKPLAPTSIYAISKRDQEEMVLTVGAAYGIPAVALRYFNIYGPRQALSNPYTGVAAIFSSRLLSSQSPVIYEDGLQSRDFIHVRDVVEASIMTLEKSSADHKVFNVGTGRRLSVLQMAQILIQKLDPGSHPEILDRFRKADVRHCFADISRIRDVLGFEPMIRFEQGIDDLTTWVKGQEAVDSFMVAAEQLDSKGLLT